MNDIKEMKDEELEKVSGGIQEVNCLDYAEHDADAENLGGNDSCKKAKANNRQCLCCKYGPSLYIDNGSGMPK